MRQNDLFPPPGSRHTPKRVGRGDSSGHGSYSGKGQKGQKARSGNKLRPVFEGGQLPIVKRLPEKRGFTNKFRIEYDVVNVGQLGAFPADTVVTPELLANNRLISSIRKLVKVLGDGNIEVALKVKANKFSVSAREKIETAGGSVEEIKSAVQ